MKRSMTLPFRTQNSLKHIFNPVLFNSIYGSSALLHALNEELAESRKRKRGLLTGLSHVQIPLHNNESETDLRERVLKRRISYGNRS